MKFKLNLDQVDEILSEFGMSLEAAKKAGAHLRSRPRTTGRKSTARIEQENLEAVDRGRDLDKIDKASDGVVLAAVRRDGIQIRFVKHQSESLQLEALRSASNGGGWRTPEIMACINDPTEAVRTEAMRLNGRAIEHVPQPWSHQLMMTAVCQDGRALESIRKITGTDGQLGPDPPEDICMAAVKQNAHSIQHIMDPSEEVQLTAVMQSGGAVVFLKKPSRKVQLAAVHNDGRAVRYLKRQLSEEVQLAAVQQDPTALQYIKNPLENVQLAAVRVDPSVILYIKDPSEEIMLEAVTRNGMLISSLVAVATKEMRLAAVRQSGHALQYLKNLPDDQELEELELEAVKQDWNAIAHVMNPSEAVLREFLTHYVTDTVHTI